MKNSVILVGNDINNVTQSLSWKELVRLLIYEANVDKVVNQHPDKPFPLLYEEIYLLSYQNSKKPENTLKDYIAQLTSRLIPNSVYDIILGLSIKNILTTNYDILFEKALLPGIEKVANKGIIKETKYSLFRKHVVNGFTIWHIHGAQSQPQTITLGYEHYCGYLQQMRNYISTGMYGVYKSKDFAPFMRRLKEGKYNHESWVEYFFTHDIYILGLSLDIVEMHLWWLLTYRGRKLIENKHQIKNSIYYFYPDKYEILSRTKLELFRSLGVETNSVKFIGKDKQGYYEEVVRKIKILSK